MITVADPEEVAVSIPLSLSNVLKNKNDHILITMCSRMHFVFGGEEFSRTAQKWNESGFRPPLCTYRLNWAKRTSWGWWDDWDDTVLQTQDSKFEPWRSEAEHATSRSRRLPTILTFTRGWGRNILFLSNRRDREPNPELWRKRQRC